MIDKFDLTKQVKKALTVLTGHRKTEAKCKQSIKEATFMCKCATSVKGNIVEIGTAHGGGTILLCLASPESVVYTIDNRKEYGERSAALISKYPIKSNKFNIITGLSEDVAKTWNHGEVDLLFIDGEHWEDPVFGDISTWLPHVKQGGLVLFHDYFEEKDWNGSRWKCGVKKGIDKYMKNNNDLVFVEKKKSMYLMRKV